MNCVGYVISLACSKVEEFEFNRTKDIQTHLGSKDIVLVSISYKYLMC